MSARFVMLVLVTGATGFLGRRVVSELQARHHSVRCLVHNPGGERVFPSLTPDVYYGNVSDPVALEVAALVVEVGIHPCAITRQRQRATFDRPIIESPLDGHF